jgi:hypothetical protein
MPLGLHPHFPEHSEGFELTTGQNLTRLLGQKFPPIILYAFIWWFLSWERGGLSVLDAVA